MKPLVARQSGGIAGALLGLMAALVTIAVLLFAIDRLVLDGRYWDQITGEQRSDLFEAPAESTAVSAARAVAIGREEARAIAESTARQYAQAAARDEIARRTGDVMDGDDTNLDNVPDVDQLIAQLSGSEQIAARQARRVAEEIATTVATQQALDELDRYTDSITAYDFGTDTNGVDAATDADTSTDAPDQSDAPVTTARAPSDPEPEPAPAPTTGADDTPEASRATTAPAASEPTAATPAAAASPPTTTQTSSAPATQPASQPRARPAPKAPARERDATSPEPTTAAPTPPPAQSLKPWWPDPRTVPGDALALRFAGVAANDDHGIALLFSQAVADPQDASDHVTIRDGRGNTVAVDWSAARNPAMIQSNALPPGRYVVIIASTLAATNGATLTQRLQGPVYVTE